jgi:hypothetical protein
LLAGRLDDPGQHQVSEHRVSTGGLVEPEQLAGPAQRAPQMPHPRGDDGQRPRPARRLLAGVQVQLELILATGQPLHRGGLERLQLLLVVGGSDVLHASCPRRLEYTICTAVAPEAVLTVRT